MYPALFYRPHVNYSVQVFVTPVFRYTGPETIKSQTNGSSEVREVASHCSLIVTSSSEVRGCPELSTLLSLLTKTAGEGRESVPR